MAAECWDFVAVVISLNLLAIQKEVEPKIWTATIPILQKIFANTLE